MIIFGREGNEDGRESQQEIKRSWRRYTTIPISLLLLLLFAVPMKT